MTRAYDPEDQAVGTEARDKDGNGLRVCLEQIFWWISDLDEGQNDRNEECNYVIRIIWCRGSVQKLQTKIVVDEIHVDDMIERILALHRSHFPVTTSKKYFLV